jgi:hypothetical protein
MMVDFPFIHATSLASPKTAVSQPIRRVEHMRQMDPACVVSRSSVEAEINSVSVDWKPLRQSLQCPCGSSLHEPTVAKTHCRCCGRVFCQRCVLRKSKLPGHLSQKPVPVCNACHAKLAATGKTSDADRNHEKI